MMKTFESGWQSRDGINFYARGWEPDGRPRAIICFVHGLGEHISRYDHVGLALTKAGYAMLGFDLRGHGKSGGPRGHTPSLEAFMSDIDLLLEHATQRYPGLPRFFYGHSLGGLLTLTYVLLRRPAVVGVVATSSGLRSALQEQKVKIALVKLLGSILPNLTLRSGLDPAAISHDPRVVDAYIKDPLVHDLSSTSFGKAALQAVDYALGHASEFPVPLLIMHGKADRLTYAAGSEEFARHVPGDVTLKIWDGLYHEMHNEPEQDEVLKLIVNWLDAHLKQK